MQLHPYSETVYKLCDDCLNKKKEENYKRSSIRMKENNPMFNSDTVNKMKETIQKHIADGTITYKHGSEHWLWKGNRELNGYVRVGLRKWVKHMFENAHFTCQHCGKTHTELQVHHTKPLRNIISEFLDKHNYTIEYMNSIIGSKEYNNFIQEIIDYHFQENENIGIVVCPECHNELDPYYKRKNHDKN